MMLCRDLCLVMHPPHLEWWPACQCLRKYLLNAIFWCDLSCLMLTAILLDNILPSQRSYHDLMFIFIYYIYYTLITSKLTFIKTCFQLQNQINHAGGIKSNETENVSRSPCPIKQETFRIGDSPSQWELTHLRRLTITNYCFSNIVPHLLLPIM